MKNYMRSARRRKFLALLLAALATATFSLVFAPPSQAASGYRFVNFNSLLCVQTNPANGSTGIQLVQDSCTDGNGNTPPGALWNLQSIGNAMYNIINVGNGGCLDAVTNTDFGVVETFPCTGISNQKWSFTLGPDPQTSELIAHVAGGSRCLDVLERSSSPGATIDIFHCTSSNTNLNTAQLFFISAV